MPLFRQVQLSSSSQYAIWEIDESESFFVDQLGFSSLQKTEKRRLEFLASRYLLHYLIPDFPFSKLKNQVEGKPFIENFGLHFSISHSFPFVAAAVGPQPIGIDVQVYQEKILRLGHKFLSQDEQVLFENETKSITLAWSAKEAAFKWFGKGGVDWIRHMPIRNVTMKKENFILEMDFLKTIPAQKLFLEGGMEEKFAWAII